MADEHHCFKENEKEVEHSGRRMQFYLSAPMPERTAYPAYGEGS